MIAFWIVAAVLSVAAAGLMLAWARRGVGQAPAGDPALEVHRRQLAEIDDLVARGLLSAEEQAEARAEAGRRLLAVADRPTLTTSAGGRTVAIVVAVAVPILSLGLYAMVGSPGRPDAPMDARIRQWSQNPEAMTAQQRAAALSKVELKRPNDATLLKLLAMARLESGDAYGASKALRRAVAISPGNAELWDLLGQTFVTLSGDPLDPDAQRVFAEAARLDPKAIAPRYYLGRRQIAEGRTADGLAIWRAVLADLPAAEDNHAALSAEIAQVERTGGLAPPAAADGPDIQAMVDGLAARLEAEPDDPEGWARLVRAYAVLGQTARRDAALARARALFKDRPDVLATLESASERPQ